MENDSKNRKSSTRKMCTGERERDRENGERIARETSMRSTSKWMNDNNNKYTNGHIGKTPTK